MEIFESFGLATADGNTYTVKPTLSYHVEIDGQVITYIGNANWPREDFAMVPAKIPNGVNAQKVWELARALNRYLNLE